MVLVGRKVCQQHRSQNPNSTHLKARQDFRNITFVIFFIIYVFSCLDIFLGMAHKRQSSRSGSMPMDRPPPARVDNLYVVRIFKHASRRKKDRDKQVIFFFDIWQIISNFVEPKFFNPLLSSSHYTAN